MNDNKEDIINFSKFLEFIGYPMIYKKYLLKDTNYIVLYDSVKDIDIFPVIPDIIYVIGEYHFESIKDFKKFIFKNRINNIVSSKPLLEAQKQK